MTAIELLFFLIRLGLSLGLGAVLWRFHPILGLVAGVGVFMVTPKLTTFLVNRFGDMPRGKPPCSNGRCRDDDYAWVRSIDGMPVCRCNCGIEYVVSGRRIMRLDAEEHRHPYLIWNGKEGWVVDENVA
jgi:hypothetical protein